MGIRKNILLPDFSLDFYFGIEPQTIPVFLPEVVMHKHDILNVIIKFAVLIANLFITGQQYLKPLHALAPAYQPLSH